MAATTPPVLASCATGQTTCGDKLSASNSAGEAVTRRELSVTAAKPCDISVQCPSGKGDGEAATASATSPVDRQ